MAPGWGDRLGMVRLRVLPEGVFLISEGPGRGDSEGGPWGWGGHGWGTGTGNGWGGPYRDGWGVALRWGDVAGELWSVTGGVTTEGPWCGQCRDGGTWLRAPGGGVMGEGVMAEHPW